LSSPLCKRGTQIRFKSHAFVTGVLGTALPRRLTTDLNGFSQRIILPVPGVEPASLVEVRGVEPQFIRTRGVPEKPIPRSYWRVGGPCLSLLLFLVHLVVVRCRSSHLSRSSVRLGGLCLIANWWAMPQCVRVGYASLRTNGIGVRMGSEWDLGLEWGLEWGQTGVTMGLEWDWG